MQPTTPTQAVAANTHIKPRNTKENNFSQKGKQTVCV